MTPPRKPRGPAKTQPPHEPLKNARHERFAQETAKGIEYVAAYRNICGTGNSCEHSTASKWARLPQIQARVIYLKGKSASHTVMTVTERRTISANIARDPNVEPGVRLNATVIEAKHAGEFMERQDLTTDGQALPTAMPQIVFNLPASFTKDRKKA